MKLKLIATIFVILLISSYLVYLFGTKNPKSLVDNSAESPKENNKINTDSILTINAYNDYIKIYGLLKYYHPLYSSGRMDINSVFKKYLIPKDSITSAKIFNQYVDSLLYNAEISIESRKTPLLHLNKNNLLFNWTEYSLELYNSDSLFSWIENSLLLNKKNKRELISITRNTNQREHLKYVKNHEGNVGNTIFINEDVPNDTVFPVYENRMLALAKYWNMLNYFYPYKSEIDNFDNLLFKYLNSIKYCTSAMQYQLLITELIAEINDGHVRLKNQVLFDYLGDKFLPFKVEYADSNFYINKISSNKNGFHRGDRIIEIDDYSINFIIENLKRYLNSRNKVLFNKKICQYMVYTHLDSLTVKIQRDKKELLVKTKTISYQEYYRKLIYNRHKQIIKQGNKIYLNVRLVRKPEIDFAFDNYDTIILDLRINIRTGLQYDICNRLISEPMKYGLFTMPDLNNPGKFLSKDNYLCGELNKNFFTGCLYVIINENTMSQGEAACMMFSLYENTILIGRNTKGANGNVSNINLPGKIQTRFSGVGVFGLHGENYQNIGIKPDIYIERTKFDIISNSDEILEYLSINYKTLLKKN